MRILAIDPGTQCGYAVGDESEVNASGKWDIKPGRGDSPGMRYLKLRSKLNTTCAAFPDIKLVVYEQPQAFLVKYRGGTASQIAYGLAGEIESWCAGVGLNHTAVPATTLKKWATGKGNANKDAMVRIGRERFERCGVRLTTDSDDEVDALWLLHYAVLEWGTAEKQSAEGKVAPW
jgi:Holliday junction resolvasome RuvABC endonuclease subunit